MFTTALSPRVICLIGYVAVATMATPSHDAQNPSDDAMCASAPLPDGGPDCGSPDHPDCGSPDHPDSWPAFENAFSDVRRGEVDQVRSVNSSTFITHQLLRKVQRLTPGGVSQSQDLTLWMFVEFLKAAPLFMGMGCIMTIFVALRQKWSDLATSESSVKIQWTKPAAC